MTSKETQTSECRLLSLAPEIRNLIYRAVLVEGDIQVEAPNHIPQPPALLQTCKQIQAEASGIYYQENRFCFGITNNDATLYIRWCTGLRRGLDANPVYDIEPSSNWDNLRQWLKAAFEGRCGGPLPIGVDQTPCHDEAAARLHSMVARLRNQSNVSWAVADMVLEDAHQALAALDSAWA